MGAIDSFLGKFGTGGMEEVSPEANLLSSNAPDALGAFMDKFTTMTESFWFYNNTVELRFDKDKHVYFKVDPELGNLIEQYGVTTVLRIIDRSDALVPWGAKKVIEKLLRLIPSITDEKGIIWIAPMTLEEFTKIAMDAKTAPKDILEDAGDIGALAHKCLEDSIQYALDNNEDKIVRELRDVPSDEKACSCANAAKVWMDAHNVRWIKTERKIYSLKYEYAGTMDGLATVDSCSDRSCCSEEFKDRLSLIDWKSSNHLHIEYLFQTASYEQAEEEEHGVDIVDRWILRLGKDGEEAGKFEPWHMVAKDFQEDLNGFLACLALVKLVDSVNERMKSQKKGVREAKKAMRDALKELEKVAKKLEREKARAQAKLERAAEKERIKAEAKKNREEARLAKKNGVHSAVVPETTSEALPVREVVPDVTKESPAPSVDGGVEQNLVEKIEVLGPEPIDHGSVEHLTPDEFDALITSAKEHVMTSEEKEEQRRSFAHGNVALHNPEVTREVIDRAAELLYEAPVERKPFLVPEEK